MVSGLFSASQSMKAILEKQDVTANNLANAQTAGFKIGRLVTHVEVGKAVNSEGRLNASDLQRVDEVRLDWSPGPMIASGNPLDVAIRGEGFLAVETPKGTRYIRSASLRVNGENTLVDMTGSPLLDVGGHSLKVSGVHNEIRSDGRVFSDGEEVASVMLVDFPKPYQLNQEGAGRFAPFAVAGGDVPRPVPVQQNVKLETGYLEGSNANAVATMVQMISQFRNYEADSRVISAVDGTLDKAVNQLGRVGA